MKAPLIVLLFLATLCLNAQAQDRSAGREALAKKVVGALAAKDEAAFLACYADQEDIQYAVSHYDFGDRQARFKEQGLEQAQEIAKSAPQIFRETLTEGEEEGLVWSEVTFDQIESHHLTREGRQPIDLANVSFTIRYKDRTFAMLLDDAWRGKEGFVIGDLGEVFRGEIITEERMMQLYEEEMRNQDGVRENDSREALAKRALAALIAQDEAAFVNLYADEDDIQYLLNNVIPADQKVRAQEQVEAHLEKLKAGAPDMYREAISKGKLLGLDWTALEFYRLVGPATISTEKSPHEKGDIDFLAKAGDKYYLFQLDDCWRGANGFVIADLREVLKGEISDEELKRNGF